MSGARRNRLSQWCWVSADSSPSWSARQKASSRAPACFAVCTNKACWRTELACSNNSKATTVHYVLMSSRTTHHPPKHPFTAPHNFQHRYTSSKQIQHAHNRASAQAATLKSHCSAATHADSPPISKAHFPQQHKPTIASMPTTKSVALKATHHSSPTMHLHCDPAHHHKCAHLHTSTL